MNRLIVKEFNGSKLHTFMWNNKPCWIANELVAMFEYADPSKTITQCIKAEEFEVGSEYEVLTKDALRSFKSLANEQTTSTVVSKNTKSLTIFYEDGLYGFLQYTDKPIGIQFRKWLRREVLPEIRETGSYVAKKTINTSESTTSKGPWFIKMLDGRQIITLHDFHELTGLDIKYQKPFFHPSYFTAGVDWNGLGQGSKRERFEKENNVHYDDETFLYMYASGVIKVLSILTNHPKLKLKPELIETIHNELTNHKAKLIDTSNSSSALPFKSNPNVPKIPPIQINIMLGENVKTTRI